MVIREMNADDYAGAYELWSRTEGIGLSEADSEDRIRSFLARNPGLSFVAVDDGRIVGTVLCGHDGRRGYLYHVAVSEPYRNRGIGNRLVAFALQRLRDEQIDKCHLFVMCDNDLGVAFWSGAGWTRRGDILIFSNTP
jgi:ribosomal protein S18 acetylase RimI-like enzyme